MGFPANIPPAVLPTSAAMVARYADLTHDYNRLHLDAEFAATTSFGQPIAHGTLALNLLLVAIERHCPAHALIALDIRFTAPTPVGATLTTFAHLTDPVAGVYEVGATIGPDRIVLQGTARLMPAHP